MKRLLLIIVALVLLTTCAGAVMRTPITKPGFDNIPTIIEIDMVATTVVDTTSETTLCEITIPRNTLGQTDRVAKMDIEWIGLNDSGSNVTLTWRVYYGSSAALVIPGDIWATNVNPRQGQFIAWLLNMGAVDDQQIVGKDLDEKFVGNYDRISQDSNEDLDLKVTAQFSVADPDILIRNLICIVTQMAP